MSYGVVGCISNRRHEGPPRIPSPVGTPDIVITMVNDSSVMDYRFLLNWTAADRAAILVPLVDRQSFFLEVLRLGYHSGGFSSQTALQVLMR
jgi:hypothetical protein